jgi:hypothetical protein
MAVAPPLSHLRPLSLRQEPPMDWSTLHTSVSPRATAATESDLRARVCAEFREMPGLTLTRDQAARLFGLDKDGCERVLGSLVRSGLLWTDGRAFARADAGRRCA